MGGPCEGCEDVFDGLPKEIGAFSRIAMSGEPGEPLRITGQVFHQDSTVAPGIVVYAYHTDAHGIYPRRDSRGREALNGHGALRGWAKSDSLGRYQFETIRPAGYPDSDIQQHVHLHIVEPGRCTYWIDDIVFSDDPRLIRASLPDPKSARGGSGVTAPIRDSAGVWQVNRDIYLGHGVSDYQNCAK